MGACGRFVLIGCGGVCSSRADHWQLSVQIRPIGSMRSRTDTGCSFCRSVERPLGKALGEQGVRKAGRNTLGKQSFGTVPCVGRDVRWPVTWWEAKVCTLCVVLYTRPSAPT